VQYGEKNKELNQYDGGNRNEQQYESDAIDYDYHEMFKTIFSNLEPYWTEYNTFYIWSGGLHLHEIRLAMQDSPNIIWGDYLTWIKNQHVFSRKDYQPQHEFCIYGWYNKHRFYPETSRPTILNYNKPLSNDIHPAMKPIALIKQTIEDGTKEGDNILDLFTGSGTALIAAEQSNRNFYGIELDPHYCDVIIKRWEDYTNQKATKITYE
jgi:site-specific DNA-methyltransferase (adenine-specific)